MYDTVKGSDYLGDQDAIAILARDAPRAVLELEHMGVPFSRNPEGKIAQRAFGGHTREFGKAPVKRACYASDRTGRVVLDTLYEQCIKTDVKFYREFYLMDLLFRDERCCGVVLRDLATGDLHTIEARAVLLATGGAGKVFRTTSNCFANTGDGLSLAWRQGLPLQDMEFVQFHPTGIRGFGILVSEAARGEGGILRNSTRERFMERYAPAIKDLAPRDIVARSIMQEIREGRGIGGGDYVHLDLTHLGEEILNEKLWEITSFTRIYAGVDPVNEPVPVQPTCHYMMGGIPTDNDGRVLKNGKADPVDGLFAAGECACISVHGANRLGTNSLLDLVVFGRRAGQAIRLWLSGSGPCSPPADADDRTREGLDSLLNGTGKEQVPAIRESMQASMMENASVFRHENGLKQTAGLLENLRFRFAEVRVADQSAAFNYELMEAVECGHLLDVAESIVHSALSRRESRGAHFREDFVDRDDQNFLHHTLIYRAEGGFRFESRPVNITRFEPKPRIY